MEKTGPTDAYAITSRNRVKRLHERGRYDRTTVHAILDAAMLCHIAYVIDGQPYCTPTVFWREGDHLFWHGSSASRMLRAQAPGIPVCLTVTHMDALVLARCGFNHSIDYRSVMAFGTASIVADGDRKARALSAMIDRFYPGRDATLRPSTVQELKATTLLGMEIEQASGKIRDKGVNDDEADLPLPIFAARIPVSVVVGAMEPSPHLPPGVARPAGLSVYEPGRRLDAVMTQTARRAYDSDAVD